MAREVARAARESGDTERALLLYARAEWLDDWAASERRLTVKHARTSLNPVTPARREAISRGLGRVNPNLEAAREATKDKPKAEQIPSLRALAKRLGCTVSFLSQVASGDRPMPPAKAAAFRKLTGKDWQ